MTSSLRNEVRGMIMDETQLNRVSIFVGLLST